MLDMWTLFTRMLEVLALLERLATSISSQMVAPGNLAAKSNYFVSYTEEHFLKLTSETNQSPFKKAFVWTVTPHRSYPERALLAFCFVCLFFGCF